MIGKIIEKICFWMAMLGGTSLFLIVVLICASVVGRSLVPLGLSPVPGDFELVEALIAFGVFNFMPWCQLKNGHVRVDVLKNSFPGWMNRIIDLLTLVLMTLVGLFIVWRLILGALDAKDYGETSFILQFPLWWAYVSGIPAALFLPVVSFYGLFVKQTSEDAFG